MFLPVAVYHIGASALDKRSKKAWEVRMLTQLGASVEKGPRHPAGIGKGLAKAAAKREAKALQEAIDAGLVKVKGRGKKIKREKGAERKGGWGCSCLCCIIALILD